MYIFAEKKHAEKLILYLTYLLTKTKTIMRKIKLLLTAMLAMTAWTGVMAQDTNDAEYVAAKEAITDGATYRIKTTVSGTDYYVTTAGALTQNIANAGMFEITKTSGGHFGTGFRISSGTDRFTNPPLSNNVANLTPGSFAHSTGDRGDWERQVLYLNNNGKYAIRSCNVADGTSSWSDAGRTHWNVYTVGDVVTPRYNYEKYYIWDFEGPLTTVNVTYKLFESDGTTQVKSVTVKQEANSAVNIKNVTCWVNYGYQFEDFRYDYVAEGTIGATDCTINVTRTLKPGTVQALADLSNEKAYEIGCERGAFLVADGKMIAQCLDAAAAESPRGKFAVINYESKYFLYNTEENMFVKKDGSLANNIYTDGFSAEDAVVLTEQGGGLFMMAFNVADHVINVNSNQPLGYVINNYSTPDPGNKFFMVAEASFDPTNALATLQEFFHPTHFVKYVIKEGENVLYTSEPQPTYVGAQYTALPEDFKRPFYTYADIDVTVADVETTTINVAATWAGPFEISTDFASAHWYDMAMRSTWYVTSAVKDADGAYKTQNANTMGLVEDSYQWAFIGNGYAGFKIINKAWDGGYSFGWKDADAVSGGIPTIMSDTEGNHAWSIVPSTNTSVPEGSFCIGVPGTNVYINQYGGEGGSVKFWNSTGNYGDAGSAFTVFDVPTNFAEYLVADGIADAFTSTATGYFTLTEEAKAQFDPAYQKECAFETYKALTELLSKTTSYILPASGYYLLKNKNYGTYMGIDPSDGNFYGNYNASVVPQPKHVVKLTYEGLSEAGNVQYSIGLMGVYVPDAIAQSTQVTAVEDNCKLTLVVPALGYAAFMGDPESQFSALHCAGGGSIVGWESSADASQWTVEVATTYDLTVTEAGYATAYLPFDATPVATTSPSIEIPEAKGVWTFDDGTTTGTGTATLAASSGVTFDGGAVTVPVGDKLTMTTNAGGDLSTYTFLMDVNVPADKGSDSNLNSYTSLFSNKPANDGDGSLFFKWTTSGRGIGLNYCNLGYNGNFDLGTTYRVVFVCVDNVATVYVNGAQVGQATAASTTQSQDHWTLRDAVLFFADNDGEENEVVCDEIRFWDVALTAAQVAELKNAGYTPGEGELAIYTATITDGAEGITPGEYEYLTLNKLEGTVPEATPVIIKAAPSTYTFWIGEEPVPENGLRILEIEVDGSEALVKALAPVDDNDLIGTFKPIEGTDEYVLGLPKNAEEGDDYGFWPVTPGTTIPACKAYLKLEAGSGVKGFLFDFDGSATGIMAIENAQTTDGAIYNLAGQRLSKMQKGINIVNGKKVLK